MRISATSLSPGRWNTFHMAVCIVSHSAVNRLRPHFRMQNQKLAVFIILHFGPTMNPFRRENCAFFLQKNCIGIGHSNRTRQRNFPFTVWKSSSFVHLWQACHNKEKGRQNRLPFQVLYELLLIVLGLNYRHLNRISQLPTQVVMFVVVLLGELVGVVRQYHLQGLATSTFLLLKDKEPWRI